MLFSSPPFPSELPHPWTITDWCCHPRNNGNQPETGLPCVHCLTLCSRRMFFLELWLLPCWDIILATIPLIVRKGRPKEKEKRMKGTLITQRVGSGIASGGHETALFSPQLANSCCLQLWESLPTSTHPGSPGPTPGDWSSPNTRALFQYGSESQCGLFGGWTLLAVKSFGCHPWGEANKVTCYLEHWGGLNASGCLSSPTPQSLLSPAPSHQVCFPRTSSFPEVTGTWTAVG